MEWYYAVDNDQRGPVADAEFQVLVSNGTVRPNTLVWRQGMAEWSPYSALSGGSPNYTGEVGMRYAGFWIRFAAKVMDNVIVGFAGLGFVFLVTMTTATALSPDASGIATSFASILALIAHMAYYTFFVGAYGATPGKLALSLRVVRSDGTPVSYGVAFGRHIAAILNYLTLFVGWFMVGWNDQKCGLHDYICDTRVIWTE